MNIDFIQNKILQNTIGQLLARARKKAGLSQETIAKQLCLKVSIIKNIEKDNINSNIDSIFLCGYIRSYARLVNIPEKDLNPLIIKQIITKKMPVQSIKSFSIKNKSYKKRYFWFTTLSWSLFFLFLAVIYIWWCQYYHSYNDIDNITVNSSTNFLQKK